MSEHPPETRAGAEPWSDPAVQPAHEPAAEPPGVRKPARNYLARAEHRRIFWLFMPPALVAMLVLGWMERTWFGSPPTPAVPQVDTTLAEVSTDAAVADAVVIEAEPDLPPDDPGAYGASVHALAQIRDDTVFRGPEQEAWFQIWMTLRSADMRSLAQSSARRVSFIELFGQPRSHRGRLVRFRGTLHRLERMTAPANDYDIKDYWQGWLEPEGGPVSPIVVYFLRLPEGMPHGLKIGEPVEVVGYFFKRWAYAATDTVRTAPLVLALEPIWKPRAAGSPADNSIGTVALVTMAAVVALTLLGIRAASSGPARRQPPAPADLSTALADVDLFSAEESLRRMAEMERPPDRSPTKESTP